MKAIKDNREKIFPPFKIHDKMHESVSFIPGNSKQNGEGIFIDKLDQNYELYSPPCGSGRQK